MRYPVSAFGFTSRPLASDSKGFRWNGEAVGLETHLGYNWPARGFRINRIISTSTLKAAGRWPHKHSDGTEYVLAYDLNSLYEDTGVDSPSTIAAALTETFVPTVVNIASPAGISVFLNGTNAQARAIRKGSGADLDAVLFDMAAPASVVLTQGAGGTLADGTYYVATQWVDDAGSVTVYSGPTVQSVLIAAGGGTASISVPLPAAPPSRATKIRLYIGTASTPTSLFYDSDNTLVGAPYTITALSTSIVVPTNRNGAYQTSVMPLANARYAVEHLNRLFIQAANSYEVYWSERDAPNQWYGTNGINTEADGGWSGHGRGLASLAGTLYVFTTAGIFAVFGSFARDTLGSNPTYRADVGPPQRISSLVCAAPGSIATTENAIFFMSEQGPAVVMAGGRVETLEHEHIAHYMDRLDWAYALRWPGTIDANRNYYCVAVTRKTNSSRPADGGANAGFCDRMLKFDIRRWMYATPEAIGDIVHLSSGHAGVGGAAATQKSYLWACGGYGRILRLDLGWSGGGPLDISGTGYDAMLATSNTTVTAVVTYGSHADDALIGMLVVLKYPDDDTAYPGWEVERIISDNATVTGSLTLTWQGALTVPSGSGKWTVRIAGRLVREDIRDDFRRYVQMKNPGGKLQLLGMTAQLHHVVGAEAVA